MNPRISDLALEKLGGKAANLLRLSRMQVRVPTWAVLPTDLFDQFLNTGDLGQRVRALSGEAESNLASAASVSERIRALLMEKPLSSNLTQEILGRYQGTFDSQTYIAVRSSAVGEDAQGASFAGQLDTFLFVRGEEDVLRSVKQCWASAYSERSLHYRVKNHLALSNVQVAVILQEMVRSEVSGVLFTVNPTSGRTDEMLISATYGLGEGIVSGRLETDVFEAPRSGKKPVRSTLVNKTERVVFDEKQKKGTLIEPVPLALQQGPCLSPAQLAELVKAGQRMEQGFGVPQDIEFAIASGRLYILQARPVTAGLERPFHLVWDNSNIIESYSGVTSPLTFSFIRKAYAIVYHQFCQVMGVPSPVIFANTPTFENMLGLIKGRVYYNLLNWYQLVSLFPGFQYNREFMEQMMGVKKSLAVDFDNEASWAQRYLVDFPRLLRLVGRMARNFRGLPSLVSDFMSYFKGIYEHYDAIHFEDLRPHALLKSYEDLERRLLWNWKAPIINDFFAMMFYGTLRKLVQTWELDPDGTLQNDLLCGEGGLESTLPTRRLLEIASTVRANPASIALFQEKSDDDLAQELLRTPPPTDLHRDLQRFLKEYGFRCMNELKLEEPSLRDDPRFLIRMIRNYLQSQVKEPAEMDRREADIRRKAEALAAERLGNKAILKIIPRRWVFQWVLRHTRTCVKNRENMRFARTKIYGILRGIFRAMGYHLAKEGRLDHAHDVFYLTMDEVWGYVRGTTASLGFKKLASLRKEEFEAYKKEDVPDRFETDGAVHSQANEQRLQTTRTASLDSELRGIGCCPGVVTHDVKYIASPSDDLSVGGLILVAERTDPGWVPLYPTVSGLLIERGSPLSHSAIVAREMGIPTIVGIPSLTQMLGTGDRVTMDGSTGVVKILNKSART